MSEFEDRQVLITHTAQLPEIKFRSELADLRQELKNHISEHPSCTDDCPNRQVILNQISIYIAAEDIRKTQSPPRP
jgi:hypothetical protein